MDGAVLLGLAGVLLAVLFGCYAVWARYNPRTDADVRYGARHAVVAPLIPKRKREVFEDAIGLAYKGVPVDLIAELDLSFRNYGPSRLNADDQETPVVVKLIGKTGSVLEADGDCVVEVEGQTVSVRLVPMNVGDVKRVRIVHSVPRKSGAEAIDFSIEGSLRNTPHGIRPSRVDPIGDFFNSAFGVIMALTSAAFVWGMAVNIAYFEETQQSWPAIVKLLVAVFGPFLLIAIPVGLVVGLPWILRPVSRPARARWERWRFRRSPFGDHLSGQ